MDHSATRLGVFSLFLFSILSVTPVLSASDKPCPAGSRDALSRELHTLQKAVRHHNERYEAGTPEISDPEFDGLIHHQNTLARCLDTTTAPTDLPPLDTRHRSPLGSLKKAAGPDDIEAFLEHARKLDSPVVLQPKIDGLAIELVYRKGKLVQAITRGQHRIGQGINLLPLTAEIPAIPQQLSDRHEEIILHGELYTRSDNPFAQKAASPRHYVAGLINRKSSSAQELQALAFFPWLWVNSPLANLTADVQQMAQWGFTAPRQHTTPVRSLKEVVQLRESYHRQTHTDAAPLTFPMDGIVLKLDRATARSRLGHRDGTPRWARAWKFPAQTEVTSVTDIQWRVGRTGKITVMLELAPVDLSGITVSRVNIGPKQYFENLDIARYDTVSLSLKGAATPVFGKVLSRPGNRIKTEVPEQSRYTALTCLSDASKDCRKQFMARLLWLTGPNGLDLPTVDVRLLEQLVSRGVLQELSQLFTLPDGSLPKEALTTLHNHQLSLEQAIRALGIPAVGQKRSGTLAKKAGRWQLILEASKAQLQGWLNCSPQQAEKMHSYLQKNEIKAVANQLFK